MSQPAPIIYTFTDEAPALATQSLLPIFRAFLRSAGIGIETRDISLAARILAGFQDFLGSAAGTDTLAELGAMVLKPSANIIKLPNISASIPQMKAAIGELQKAGFALPDYPDEPTTNVDRDVKVRYDRVKGSAVNPVLREGNSDRRAPKAVKEYARKNPPPMKPWSGDSLTHVATMRAGDFRSNEKSVTLMAATSAKIEHVAADGQTTVLKESVDLLRGEVVDATVMSKKALVAFLSEQIEDARSTGILLSLHLKATMMKVSDPILFGHAVKTYFKDVFTKHAALFDDIGVNANNGLGDVVNRIASLPANQKAEVEADIAAALESGPDLAMVDSNKGITNLHVPSDVIIDASMPPMIRDGGCMWNAAGDLQSTKALIPDSSYASVFQAVIDFCRENGALDPETMGSVANVGLMAKKAEEYGSHDKTFEMASDGMVRMVAADGTILHEHAVEAGDIWRACQTKDAPIRDWVKLAVTRARASDTPAIFWLDSERAHDAQLIAKVETYLNDHNTDGLEIKILSPADATTFSLERINKGLDTISVSGNVLRDYLTDLFPILEVGTSAKMLSIVPLMNGGGLFETGAGGSAPKHVQQFLAEGHLRWDSLGEFLALAVSLEHYATQHGAPKAQLLADALDTATTQLLLNGKSPSRRVGELDNRGSHFYLALYWAEALVAQDKDATLRKKFSSITKRLADGESSIMTELSKAQGDAVDIGGYYWPDRNLAAAAMRPSATLNEIIDSMK
ncbi:MAG: isocitrate dehydrogenase [Planctomycetota bacterium]|jgi:isocitrate dehydrogenase